jgi:CBS domain-containing protein
MRVSELMQPDVKTIGPDATIADLLVSLADARVSGVPVVDRAGRMLGVISNSDVIALEAEAEERGHATLLEETTVRDVMTPRALTISPDADVRDAARQMLYADVHRLFVASEGALVGVISTTDLTRAIAIGRV